jgi:hypothetical protein
MHVSEDSDPTSANYFEIKNLRLQKDTNVIEYQNKQYFDLSMLLFEHNCWLFYAGYLTEIH